MRRKGDKNLGTKKTAAIQEAKVAALTLTQRQYPDITLLQEKVVMLIVGGKSYRDAGATIGVSHDCVWKWLQEPAVRAAHSIEQQRVYDQIADTYPELVMNAYRTLARSMDPEDSVKPEQGKLALAFLEKTGYLVTTKEKRESDKKRTQALHSFLTEMADHMGIDLEET